MNPDLAKPSAGPLVADRRLHQRYPINVDVQYRVTGGDQVTMIGIGTACDLSTGGIRFEADQALHVGDHAELLLECAWSVPAYGLHLRIAGTIVRTVGSEVAVRIDDYNFRTRYPAPTGTIVDRTAA